MANQAEQADGDGLRDRALEEMERLLDVAITLRADLDEHAQACRRIIDGIRSTEPLGDVLDDISSQKLRPKLTDSLTAYERIRHEARLRLIALGESEGMSTADVQRHWAITRQLASRALRQVKELG